MDVLSIIALVVSIVSGSMSVFVGWIIYRTFESSLDVAKKNQIITTVEKLETYVDFIRDNRAKIELILPLFAKDTEGDPKYNDFFHQFMTKTEAIAILVNSDSISLQVMSSFMGRYLRDSYNSELKQVIKNRQTKDATAWKEAQKMCERLILHAKTN